MPAGVDAACLAVLRDAPLAAGESRVTVWFFSPAASPVSPPWTDDGRPANWCTPDWKDALQSAGASRPAADCGPFNAALPCAQHSLNHRLARWLRPWRRRGGRGCVWRGALSPLDRQCREKLIEDTLTERLTLYVADGCGTLTGLFNPSIIESLLSPITGG